MVTPPLPSLAMPSADSRAPVLAPGRTRAFALAALAKPRLAALSSLTTAVAYVTAGPPAGALPLLMLLAGTGAAAAGALSLNQWLEREADACMRRTRHRPLPSGALEPGIALGFSLACTALGAVVLAVGVNLLTAGLALLTTATYGLLYTPLKRRTRWATEIGAVAGALPALMGNAAAGDLLARPGLTLTAVLVLWQMPHFFALGWRHRDDYRAAGFPLLPVVDPTGARTAAWSVAYAAALLVVSLLPWTLGWVGSIYGVAAAALGAHFLLCAARFRQAAADRTAAATRLFHASLLYLPVTMAALVIDRSLPW